MLQVGDVLKNKFRVEKEIARGGMGAVYLATIQKLGSFVAIKEILESQAQDPGSKQGFLYEAELLRDLDSPNLPRVRDIFEEKNLLYVVMDYIEGKDLYQLLADRQKPDGAVDPFPLADVLRWAETLLETLESLHGLLTPVIHRDIKPSNLKIGPNGKLFLLDFGLAKVGQTYFKGGTLGFSSPEQEAHKTTDSRSDLYSVGATFYSLLAGVSQLVPALDRKIAVAAGNPDPLEPLDRLNPNVPRAVCDVFEKAMALDPATRPASAKEMREMLKQVFVTSPLPTIGLDQELPDPFVTPEPEEKETMDQLVTRLLQEIDKGNKHFVPASGSEADTKEFQSIAKALIFAESEGYLDGVKAVKEHQTGNDWYVLVYLTNGLSHKGMLALSNNSSGESVDSVDPVVISKTLMKLLPAQITQLALFLRTPQSALPGSSATHAEIVNALVRWAESSPTCGLSKLKKELDDLINP